MALTKVQILLIRACKAREPIQRICSIHRHYFVNIENYSVPEYSYLQMHLKRLTYLFQGMNLQNFFCSKIPI